MTKTLNKGYYSDFSPLITGSNR